MSITLSSVVHQNEDTASRDIGGLSYVVDPATNELHSFNAVATRVWQLIDGERSVAQVVDIIVDEFDVDRATAEADAVELLGQLADKGLIVT